MSEIYTYQTSHQDKALALFVALTEAGYSTQLTTMFCPEHGLEGFRLDTMATSAQFMAIRSSLHATFPSTSPVPDTVPDSWLN